MACQPSPQQLFTTPGHPAVQVRRVAKGDGCQPVSPTTNCPGVGQLPKALAYVLSVGNVGSVFWQDERDLLFIDDYDGPITLA